MIEPESKQPDPNVEIRPEGAGMSWCPGFQTVWAACWGILSVREHQAYLDCYDGSFLQGAQLSLGTGLVSLVTVC